MHQQDRTQNFKKQRANAADHHHHHPSSVHVAPLAAASPDKSSASCDAPGSLTPKSDASSVPCRWRGGFLIGGVAAERDCFIG